jgi:hypothetical protein
MVEHPYIQYGQPMAKIAAKANLNSKYPSNDLLNNC